jgi:hypothetical protein
MEHDDVSLFRPFIAAHRRAVDHGVAAEIFLKILRDDLRRDVFALPLMRSNRLADLGLHLRDEIVSARVVKIVLR